MKGLVRIVGNPNGNLGVFIKSDQVEQVDVVLSLLSLRGGKGTKLNFGSGLSSWENIFPIFMSQPQLRFPFLLF